MLCSFDTVKGRIRLQRDATNVRIEFFQPACCADESSGRPHDRNKVRDTALGLLPDFISGGLVMRAPVSIIGILIGVKIKIRMFLRKLVSDLGGAVGTFPGIG